MSQSFDRVSDYDAILKTIEIYTHAAETGDSALMKTAFADDAIMHGFIGADFVGGPIQVLFDWAAENAGGKEMKARVASIDIIGTAAAARLEVENWVGFNFTDLFSLLKTDDGWKISSKVYHTHS